MIIIGIDFSIQFPAACISRDFKTFKWISCINGPVSKVYDKFLNDIELEYKNIKLFRIEPRIKNTETYSAIERSKLVNYSNLVDNFINEILKEIGNEEQLIIAIEGVSYGAKGNALLDINQSTGMMRKSILDRILKGKANKLFIFSPSELKNSIGAKGNASKFDVYTSFINNPKMAINSHLYILINKYINQIVRGRDIRPPFMDMIDSYLAVLKVYELLKES